jgi:hypothetical protein
VIAAAAITGGSLTDGPLTTRCPMTTSAVCAWACENRAGVGEGIGDGVGLADGEAVGELDGCGETDAVGVGLVVAVDVALPTRKSFTPVRRAKPLPSMSTSSPGSTVDSSAFPVDVVSRPLLGEAFGVGVALAVGDGVALSAARIWLVAFSFESRPLNACVINPGASGTESLLPLRSTDVNRYA